VRGTPRKQPRQGLGKMDYSFDEVEYIAEDGTTFWLGGDADLKCYVEPAEPETREQPGVPASITVESIIVTLHTVALMVNDEHFGNINIKEMDKETLQKLETLTEKLIDTDAQEYASERDPRDYTD